MLSKRLKRHIAVGLAALLLGATGLPVVASSSSTQATAATSTTATPASQAAFNRNMQLMRAQMMQLRTTHGQDARTKVLDAHMRTMQKTLHMMMGQGGMHGTGSMGPGMMQGKGNGMGRSGGMMTNGRMMQMMMGQMMQHQRAMQAMGCAK